MNITYYIGDENDENTQYPVNALHTPLQILDVEEVVEKIKNIPVDFKKGFGGQVWFYETPYAEAYEVLKADPNFKSSGLLGLDIDGLDDGVAESFMEHWDIYASRMYSMCVGYISSSLKGFHIWVKTNPLNDTEYAEEGARQYAYLAKLVKEIEGVDLTIDKHILDVSALDLSHRQYTKYTPDVRYNKFAAVIDWGENKPIKKFNKVCPIPKHLIKKINTKHNNEIENNRHESLKIDSNAINYTVEFNDTGDVEYIPHQDRLKLYSSLCVIFKDKDKADEEWGKCMRRIPHKKHSLSFLLNEPVKNHWWSKQRGYRPDYSLLKLFGYTYYENFNKPQVIEKVVDDEIWTSSNENAHEVHTYLSNEYMQDIKNCIAQNQCLSIKGSTGIGKTVTIAKLARDVKGVVIVPFIDLKENYTREGLVAIENSKDYNGQACCMTYDRFVMIPTQKFIGKTIFVDESHVLYLDRSYRSNLVYTLLRLRELSKSDCKVVYISATPLLESDNLPRMEFFKARHYVHTKLYKVDSIYDTIDRMILSNEWRSKYNRMVIFSNTYARVLKDNRMYMDQQQLSIIHSDYKWTGDTDRIKGTQLLDSDVTLATSLAFNGLNFNNKDERVLVVSEIDNESTAWELVQQVGRMRNSVVDLRIVYSEHDSNKMTADEKRAKAEMYMELDDVLYKSDETYLKSDIYNAMKEIENYIVDHSGIDTIVKELKDEGYFLIDEDIIESEVKTRVVNTLRKKADKMARASVKNNLVDEGLEDSLGQYYKDNISSLRNLMVSYGCSYDSIVSLVDVVLRKMVKTIASNIELISTVIGYSDEDWNTLNDRVKESIDVANKKGDNVLARDLVNEMRRNNQIRLDYMDCKNSDDVIKLYIQRYVEEEERANNNRSNTKSKQYRLIDNTTNDVMVFSSRNDLIDYLGCSSKTIKQIMDGKSKKYKHLTIMCD